MANSFYTNSGYPGYAANGDSASARSEFAAVEAGFNKLPTLSGSNLKILRINAAGDAIEAVFLTGYKLSSTNFAPTTSAEFATVISDETGTGSVVFSGSPALTGVPTAPTAAPGTNTTQLATTEFVTTADATKSPLAGSASITTVGALSAGSITSTFGAIDIGTDSLTAGSVSTTVNATVGNTTSAITVTGSSGDPSNYYLKVVPYIDAATYVSYKFNTKHITETLGLELVGSGLVKANNGLAVTGSGTFSYSPPIAGLNAIGRFGQLTDNRGVWLGTSNASGNAMIQAYRPSDGNTAAGFQLDIGFANVPVATFSSTGLAVTGIVTPEADNTRTLGTGALRWSTVYAGTGTINTSDAREKTAIRQLTSAEITASKQISQEIGAYQWLSAIAVKGTAAREHIGLTVQRAIEIMTANGLNPMAYGFICYDQWDATTVDHPEVLAQDATYDAEGIELTPAVEYKAAWTETTRIAGDRYSFRMDELNMFIAAGFEARLAALEAV